MAEAVLKLNGIYTDAEKTAEQYVENARLKEEESKRILEETRQKADRMIAEAEKIRDAKTQQPNGICKR